MGAARITCLLLVALVTVAGCASLPGAASARPADGRTGSAVASPTRVDPAPLTAFGALRTDWDRTHVAVEAPGCLPDAAFDPDPRLDAFPECPGSRYTGTDGPTDDRVEIYLENFPAGTTREQAIAELPAELPSDAAVVRRRDTPACTLVQYRSGRLAAADPLNMPGGYVSAAVQQNPEGRWFITLMAGEVPTTTTC